MGQRVLGNPQETQGLWMLQRAKSVVDPRDIIKSVVGRLWLIEMGP